MRQHWDESSDAGELVRLATQAMRDRGLEPEFSPQALHQADTADTPAHEPNPDIRDLRHLLWCSIDNDDSRDLDQLQVVEPLPDGSIRIYVAIADVDALVKTGSPVDTHAVKNTTSVYTPARIFPMLPERFSTDLTSLNPQVDRQALVVAYTVDGRGGLSDETVLRAWVHNYAKLAYPSVGAWLVGEGPMPPAMASVPGLPEQLRLQDEVAMRLRDRRHEEGALELQTIELKTVIKDGKVTDLQDAPKDRAHALVEDFMVAANGVTTRFLTAHHFPTFRRVVMTPERWDKIEEIARSFGDQLPNDPDSGALNEFLQRRHKADPLRFPDLSLTIIKMMGAGEYRAQPAGAKSEGHFGLAVRDYSHSTAPNRRYPDLITHRLLKAALAGQRPPYSDAELEQLAQHCTKQEDNAKKVERQVRKSAAALLLRRHIGQTFEGLVTGASHKGTWIRTFRPPIEGRIVQGDQHLDVGDRVRVRLVHVDIEKGFIDFVRI
jgi:VacB/RNase II family 3'-5' exoribonuclease